MSEVTHRHMRALEPRTLFISLFVSALSAMICMQIIVKIGVSANTSIIGALLAISLAKMPIHRLKIFKSLESQNLVQTMCSAAGFSAANCAILVAGIVFVMGDLNYMFIMLTGGFIATIISIFFIYRIYDSTLYPAGAPWPPGVATAQTLIAGDEGGNKAWRLVQGIGAGVIGSMIKIPAAWIGLPGEAKYGLPMAGIGIVFIANTWSMVALGTGLLIRGYSEILFNFKLGYLPHGFMVGAGIASLIQILYILIKRSKDAKVTEDGQEYNITVPASSVKKGIWQGIIMYFAGALVLAVVSGIITQMSAFQMFTWLAWATVSSIISPMLVGLCAMRSGWFPGFAITTIFLAIGLFLNLPLIPLALLTGYIACTGPCFADMGYDLKTGWILRGKGQNIAYELEGRRQQLISEMIGALVGFAMVALFMKMFFEQGLIPPVSKVFAATIQAGANAEIMNQILKWGLVGAVIQFIGGPTRAIGVLLATGLLINFPIYGIGVLAAVVLKLIIGTERMEVREAGLIAGDGIYSFIISVIKAIR